MKTQIHSLEKECTISMLERIFMERTSCILIEDNVLEFLDETEKPDEFPATRKKRAECYLKLNKTKIFIDF